MAQQFQQQQQYKQQRQHLSSQQCYDDCSYLRRRRRENEQQQLHIRQVHQEQERSSWWCCYTVIAHNINNNISMVMNTTTTISTTANKSYYSMMMWLLFIYYCCYCTYSDIFAYAFTISPLSVSSSSALSVLRQSSMSSSITKCSNRNIKQQQFLFVPHLTRSTPRSNIDTHLHTVLHYNINRQHDDLHHHHLHNTNQNHNNNVHPCTSSLSSASATSTRSKVAALISTTGSSSTCIGNSCTQLSATSLCPASSLSSSSWTSSSHSSSSSSPHLRKQLLRRWKNLLFPSSSFQMNDNTVAVAFNNMEQQNNVLRCHDDSLNVDHDNNTHDDSVAVDDDEYHQTHLQLLKQYLQKSSSLSGNSKRRRRSSNNSNNNNNKKKLLFFLPFKRTTIPKTATPTTTPSKMTSTRRIVTSSSDIDNLSNEKDYMDVSTLMASFAKSREELNEVDKKNVMEERPQYEHHHDSSTRRPAELIMSLMSSDNVDDSRMSIVLPRSSTSSTTSFIANDEEGALQEPPHPSTMSFVIHAANHQYPNDPFDDDDNNNTETKIEYHKWKQEWVLKHTSLQALRDTFGTSPNGIWGDLDPLTTRRLYKTLLPRSLITLHCMYQNHIEELAPLAYQSRLIAKMYARERCYIHWRIVTSIYDGIRQLFKYGYFNMNGMSYKQLWDKYATIIMNEEKQEQLQRQYQMKNYDQEDDDIDDDDLMNLENLNQYDDDDFISKICLKILEKSCQTNSIVDRLVLPSSSRQTNIDNNNENQKQLQDDLRYVNEQLEEKVHQIIEQYHIHKEHRKKVKRRRIRYILLSIFFRRNKKFQKQQKILQMYDEQQQRRRLGIRIRNKKIDDIDNNYNMNKKQRKIIKRYRTLRSMVRIQKKLLLPQQQQQNVVDDITKIISNQSNENRKVNDDDYYTSTTSTVSLSSFTAAEEKIDEQRKTKRNNNNKRVGCIHFITSRILLFHR